MLKLVRVACCVLTLLVSASISTAQGKSDLLGRWIDTGKDSEGVEILFEKEFVTFFGVRVPWKVEGPGVLMFGDADYSVRLEYEFAGKELVLKQGGEESRFRRAGAPPEQAGEVEADLFARTFTGEGIALSMRGSAAEGYEGQLDWKGKSHPVEAKLHGKTLEGGFGGPENPQSFQGTLKGDDLVLVIGGERLTLRGETRRPPALEGVYDGKARRFEHPRGWFDCEIPAGWSVGPQGDEGLWLDLGLPPSPTPEALAGITWGRVPQEDLNLPVAVLMEKYVPTLREALRVEGIIIGEPEGPIRTYRGKDVPGAVVSFKGQTVTGISCGVWVGSLIKRDSWLTVSGIYAAGLQEKYVPKLKRIFLSLAPNPPERNPKLEMLLVGRTFSNSQYGRITKSAHHASYTFSAGNLVTRRLMSNVISQPGMPGINTDAERTGYYEVCGDVLFLFFETGQSAGQVLLQGNQVIGFRIGSAQYR